MKKVALRLSLLTFLVSGCVYGPKLKNKKSYLNGDNYSSVIVGAGKTKKKKSRISGTVLYKLEDRINFIYSDGYKVLLKNRSNEEVSSFILNREGRFSFSEFLPDGDYLLEVKKGDMTSKLKRIKLSGYSLENVEIFL